jgi:hypothetical protein
MLLPALRRVRHRVLLERANRILRHERPARRSLTPYSARSLEEPFVIDVIGDGDFFLPYRDALVTGLRDAGATAQGFRSLAEAGHGLRPHAVLVIGPHDHVLRHERRRLKGAVLAAIQTEQIPGGSQGGFSVSTKKLAAYLVWAPAYDLVFEWSRAAVPVLAPLGPPVIHVPHGRLVLGDAAPDPSLERFDLLFLGGLGGPDKRRRTVLRALAKDHSIHPATFATAWGEAKVTALQESRVVLNLHSESSLAFASPRFFETLSHRRLLVSEGVADPWPFVPAVDYLETGLPLLASTLRRALSDAALRHRIAEAGHARTLEHTMQRTAHRVLVHLLSRHRAIDH